MNLTEEQIIEIYREIEYSRDWFEKHKYQYRLGQGYNPLIGEYFLVDLYFDENKYDTEIWLVKGSKPKYNARRKQKLPLEPIAFITYNKQFGTVNGYWQLLQNE